MQQSHRGCDTIWHPPLKILSSFGLIFYSPYQWNIWCMWSVIMLCILSQGWRKLTVIVLSSSALIWAMLMTSPWFPALSVESELEIPTTQNVSKPTCYAVQNYLKYCCTSLAMWKITVRVIWTIGYDFMIQNSLFCFVKKVWHWNSNKFIFSISRWCKSSGGKPYSEYTCWYIYTPSFL